MINREFGRRTFMKRAGQAGSLLAVGGALESLLAACGGNVSTTPVAVSPGATTIPNAGLKIPGQMQWGADFNGGGPYVFKDPAHPNGAAIGFEVEIAAAMASLLRVSPVQVQTDYGELEAALMANHFDFIMNGWEKTADREKTELFSDPYYVYSQQIVVRKNDPRFANYNETSNVSLRLLENLVVGTGTGYKAVDDMKTDPKVIVKTYDGNLPFDDLKQKKIDAMMVDAPIIIYYVVGKGVGAQPDPEIKLLGKPIFQDNYYIGFNKQNSNAPTLLKEVNQAFDVLKKNGTLRTIYEKWSMWDEHQKDIGIV